MFKLQNDIIHETARQVKLCKIHIEWISCGLPLHALSRQHYTQIKLSIFTSENVAEAVNLLFVLNVKKKRATLDESQTPFS